MSVIDRMTQVIEAGELDDMVHDIVSQQATAINNEGVRSQIQYLHDHGGMSFQDIIDQLGKTLPPVPQTHTLNESQQEAFQRIKDVVVCQLGVEDPDDVQPDTDIRDLGADSLDMVELVMAFEEEASIMVPDADAEARGTRIWEWINYLSGRLDERKRDTD
jgi:acyl carrier protein